MLEDLEQELQKVGLETNDSKFQYVFGPHTEEMKSGVQGLPGTDQRDAGMVILGRLIRGHTFPDDIQDLRWKKAKGWGRYHAYKRILKHQGTASESSSTSSSTSGDTDDTNDDANAARPTSTGATRVTAPWHHRKSGSNEESDGWIGDAFPAVID